MFDRHRQDQELRRLHHFKRTPGREDPLLGAEIVTFFKQSVEKRQKKFGKIADAWDTLVPELLREHCCLDSLSRGTLGVIVDSSSHLYDLKQLLLAGLEKQLVLACRAAGLKKVMLKAGRWYEEREGGRKIRFEG
jgi:hypothetical protein